MLYDAWASCEGDWKKSSFLQSVKERHSATRRGVRKWLTVQEMDSRFDKDLAEQIRNRELFDEHLKKTEVREHPECIGFTPPVGLLAWLKLLLSGVPVPHLGRGGA